MTAQILKSASLLQLSVQGDFRAYSVEILVFPSPTGLPGDIYRGFFIVVRYILYILLKRSAILLKSCTFHWFFFSISTGSSVTSG
jgi:hypothetical protein